MERSCKRVICKASSDKAAVFLSGISQTEECADVLHWIAIAHPRWLLNVSDLLFMGSNFFVPRNLGLLTEHHICTVTESRFFFIYYWQIYKFLLGRKNENVQVKSRSLVPCFVVYISSSEWSLLWDSPFLMLCADCSYGCVASTIRIPINWNTYWQCFINVRQILFTYLVIYPSFLTWIAPVYICLSFLLRRLLRRSQGFAPFSFLK